jgi:hypothetical protein
MQLDPLVGRMRSVKAEMLRDIEAGGTARPGALEPFDAEIAELERVAAQAPRALVDPALRALDEGRLERAAARLAKAVAAVAPYRPEVRDITGPNGFVNLKMVAYTLSGVRPLPPDLRAGSDCGDMVLVYLALAGDERFRQRFEETVRVHLARRHDPTPPGDGG